MKFIHHYKVQNIKITSIIHIIIDRHLLALRAKSKTQNSRSKSEEIEKQSKWDQNQEEWAKMEKVEAKYMQWLGVSQKQKLIT